MATINPVCPPTQEEIVAARLYNDVFVFSAFAVAASASMTVAFGRGFGSVSMNHVVGWVSGVVLLVYALELVLRLLGRADYSEITSARGIQALQKALDASPAGQAYGETVRAQGRQFVRAEYQQARAWARTAIK